jgi:acylphosphatase
MKRLELKIYGRVQGVFFRADAAAKALNLNLSGWVSNESDENVKIIAEGDEEMLKIFLGWCKIGSELAKVEQVEVKWDEATGEFKKFEIKY